MKKAPVLLLLLPLAAGAQMYRWVDKNGVVHYSQTPPPQVQSERIAPLPPPPANPGTSDLGKYAETLDKASAEKAKAESAEQAKRQDKEERCAGARERLAKLESRPPNRLARTDANGNYVRLTAEEYNQFKADVQADIAKYCGS